MSEPAFDEGPYDFVDEPPPQKVFAPLRDANAPRVLQYRHPDVGKSMPVESEVVRDFYLPLGLLGGGVFVEMIAALIWERQHLVQAMTRVVTELTPGTATMLVAMLIAAKLRGIDLGKFSTAAFKLAAISVAPAALMQFILPILNYIPYGTIIGWIGQFILFFALLGALFDLQEDDTWYCVTTMFITQLVFWLAMQAVVHI